MKSLLLAAVVLAGVAHARSFRLDGTYLYRGDATRAGVPVAQVVFPTPDRDGGSASELNRPRPSRPWYVKVPAHTALVIRDHGGELEIEHSTGGRGGVLSSAVDLTSMSRGETVKVNNAAKTITFSRKEGFWLNEVEVRTTVTKLPNGDIQVLQARHPRNEIPAAGAVGPRFGYTLRKQ